MKKYSLLTSFLTLLILILAACGAADNPSPAEDKGPAEVDASGKARQEPAADPTEAAEAGTQAGEASAGDGAGADDQSEKGDSGQQYAGKVPAPEFPPGLDWLNTEKPLTLADLRGKAVLLDFWTYGCINCMHIIPDLKKLEEKYADELVVIGVHSAKFENEGDTDNIRRIILRYELEHPVINDNQFLVWNEYGAQAWPTLVLIDPEGRVLGFHSGEGIYEPFDRVIGGMIAEFDALGRIDRTPLALKLEKETQVDSPLLFPGKVLVDAGNNRLVIADSNHNRLVIADLDGNVLEVIGDGRPRLQDGDYETASFSRPQGMALADENTLYVADTENQAIRRVDLAERQVDTVAGTGRQNYIFSEAGPARATDLNSPWDVLYHEGMLYIAMAGNHQIWSFDPGTGLIERFAGSGREELLDGSLIEGGLNQPSGLATDGQVLYIADSEASAIRTAGLVEDGRLETIVGTGLFDFGDVDGQGDEVRLQHPLGVVYQDGQLYVADTYNSKIKIIDPQSRESSAFLGGGEAGWRDGTDPLFDEPGGLSLAGDKLYIADTNNHVIRVADLENKEVSTLVLVDMEGQLTRQPAGEEYSGRLVTLEPQAVTPGKGTISLEITIPDGYYVNDLAPFSMEWTAKEGRVTFDPEEANRRIVEPVFPLNFVAEFAEGQDRLTAELVIYYCEAESRSLCLIDRVRLSAPLTVAEGGADILVVPYAVESPVDLPGS